MNSFKVFFRYISSSDIHLLNYRSIGFFTHSETPYSDLHLVHGSTINVDNLDTPDIMDFMQAIATAVLSSSRGGHVDIFAPVATCGEELCTLYLFTDS